MGENVDSYYRQNINAHHTMVGCAFIFVGTHFYIMIYISAIIRDYFINRTDKIKSDYSGYLLTSLDSHYFYCKIV